MNIEERHKLRQHLRKERWKKGKPLNKEEMGNIAKGYLWANKKEKPKNWQPRTKSVNKISDILSKMPINEQKGGVE